MSPETQAVTSTTSPITCPHCASRKTRYRHYRDGALLDVIAVYECESCGATFELSTQAKPVTEVEQRAQTSLKRAG